MLTILSEKKRRHFYEQHLGQTRPVLFEQHPDANLMSGFTDNYIKIEAPLDEALLNEIAEVELLEFTADGNVMIELPIIV